MSLKKVIKPQLREQEKKEQKGSTQSHKTINKMARSTYLSTLTLNVNRLNCPKKPKTKQKTKDIIK